MNQNAPDNIPVADTNYTTSDVILKEPQKNWNRFNHLKLLLLICPQSLMHTVFLKNSTKWNCWIKCFIPKISKPSNNFPMANKSMKALPFHYSHPSFQASQIVLIKMQRLHFVNQSTSLIDSKLDTAKKVTTKISQFQEGMQGIKKATTTNAINEWRDDLLEFSELPTLPTPHFEPQSSIYIFPQDSLLNMTVLENWCSDDDISDPTKHIRIGSETNEQHQLRFSFNHSLQRQTTIH